MVTMRNNNDKGTSTSSIIQGFLNGQKQKFHHYSIVQEFSEVSKIVLARAVMAVVLQ